MRRLAALALAVATALFAGCAVTPAAEWQRTTFEGFPVISYVPENPRGLVFLFHGTGGSASFADRVETTDVLNRLVAQGYGFVSTSSTERTGNRRWLVTDPSLTTNPDLARLLRLRAHLVSTTPVEPGTPLVGIGMSNGARFVTLWGQAWRNAGHPVRAIWASHGRIAPPFDGPGQLTVPTFFSTSENDFTVPPGGVILDLAQTMDAGTPAEFAISRERRLTAPPYERIPGIDASEAQQIVQALIATGVWDAQGNRIEPDVETAAARAGTVSLPPSVQAQASQIADQTALQMAVHQFTAEHTQQVLGFFGRYVP
jgi:predicted esterase